VPSAVTYGASGNKWDRGPDLLQRHMINYRIQAMQKAASEIPGTTAEFLDTSRRPEEQHARRLRARPRLGDGNAWVHWCLWAHGGNRSTRTTRSSFKLAETGEALE